VSVSSNTKQNDADRFGQGGPLTATLLDPRQRLTEIGELLAAGLMRLRARKSSGLVPRDQDFSLETLARQSGAVAKFEGDRR
jgi:hypothetical protein